MSECHVIYHTSVLLTCSVHTLVVSPMISHIKNKAIHLLNHLKLLYASNDL